MLIARNVRYSCRPSYPAAHHCLLDASTLLQTYSQGFLGRMKFSLDDEEGELYLHGAKPGTAQEHTPDHHPHLNLSETMIPYPTVEPGDTGMTIAD